MKRGSSSNFVLIAQRGPWTVVMQMWTWNYPFPFCSISKYAWLYVFSPQSVSGAAHSMSGPHGIGFSHISQSLHMYMGGKHFLSDQYVKSAVNSYLTKLDKLFCRTGIEKLVQRYDKCLNLYGDYVEKWAECQNKIY